MELKMNKLIFLFVILTCMVSCNESKIEENYYNIFLVEEYEPKIDMPYLELTRYQEYRCIMNNAGGFYDGENRFAYSWNKEHHYIPGNDLEIVFTRDRYCPINGLRPENCLTGAKLINNKLMAYYILWQNRSVEPLLDTNKNYGRYFSSFYDKEKDTTIREFHSMNAKFIWEISEQTDTLISNLDLKIIKSLFPKFKGHFRKINVDKIFLNYDLAITTYDFYSDIKFNNYELGFSRNYHRLREFLKNEQEYLP